MSQFEMSHSHLSSDDSFSFSSYSSSPFSGVGSGLSSNVGSALSALPRHLQQYPYSRSNSQQALDRPMSGSSGSSAPTGVRGLSSYGAGMMMGSSDGGRSSLNSSPSPRLSALQAAQTPFVPCVNLDSLERRHDCPSGFEEHHPPAHGGVHHHHHRNGSFGYSPTQCSPSPSPPPSNYPNQKFVPDFLLPQINTPHSASRRHPHPQSHSQAQQRHQSPSRTFTNSPHSQNSRIGLLPNTNQGQSVADNQVAIHNYDHMDSLMELANQTSNKLPSPLPMHMQQSMQRTPSPSPTSLMNESGRNVMATPHMPNRVRLGSAHGPSPANGSASPIPTRSRFAQLGQQSMQSSHATSQHQRRMDSNGDFVFDGMENTSRPQTGNAQVVPLSSNFTVDQSPIQAVRRLGSRGPQQTPFSPQQAFSWQQPQLSPTSFGQQSPTSYTPSSRHAPALRSTFDDSAMMDGTGSGESTPVHSFHNRSKVSRWNMNVNSSVIPGSDADVTASYANADVTMSDSPTSEMRSLRIGV